MKIKVVVVDDSALIRSVMKEIINSQPDMEVVGMAPDPIVARDLIKQTNHDVLTLDVEMPRMDGLDFLEKLMRLRPMPVVMVSSLTEHGSEITLRALELGAVDFVTKPKLSIQSGMLAMKNAGAYTFAQDEASCVVFGMPREAIAIGAAHEVGALSALPTMVLGFLTAQGSRSLRV